MIYTDVATGERTRKIRAHRGIINTLDRTMGGGAGTELVATGSDDGTVKIWEGGHEASKQAVATFELGCPVTAVCWSADGSNLYIGALDNEIHVCTRFLIIANPVLTRESLRSTTFVNKQKYRHYPVIPTLQPRLRSPPMGLSSSPLRSHHKPSSTTLGRSPHLRRAYIECLRVPPRVSRTHCSGEPGVKTTADSASPLEALTGRLPFGTSRARRFFIRFGLAFSCLIKTYTRFSASRSQGHSHLR
jgi:WD40 repeat protein